MPKYVWTQPGPTVAGMRHSDTFMEPKFSSNGRYLDVGNSPDSASNTDGKVLESKLLTTTE